MAVPTYSGIPKPSNAVIMAVPAFSDIAKLSNDVGRAKWCFLSSMLMLDTQILNKDFYHVTAGTHGTRSTHSDT